MKNPAKGCHAAHTTSVVLAFVVFAFATALAFKDAAQASPNAVLQQQIEGTYDSVGRNPDGSRYEGRGQHRRFKNDTVYHQVWNIAGEAFQRPGFALSGNTLVIDWGEARTGDLYRSNPMARSSGTWAAGRGTLIHSARCR